MANKGILFMKKKNKIYIIKRKYLNRITVENAIKNVIKSHL